MRTPRPRAVKSHRCLRAVLLQAEGPRLPGEGLNSRQALWTEKGLGVYLLLNSLRPWVGRFWSGPQMGAGVCMPSISFWLCLLGLRPGDQWSQVLVARRLGRRSRLPSAGEVGSHLMLGAGGRRPLPGGGRLFSVMTALPPAPEPASSAPLLWEPRLAPVAQAEPAAGDWSVFLCFTAKDEGLRGIDWDIQVPLLMTLLTINFMKT